MNRYVSAGGMLASVINSMHEPAWVIDAQGAAELVNAAAARFLKGPTDLAAPSSWPDFADQGDELSSAVNVARCDGKARMDFPRGTLELTALEDGRVLVIVVPARPPEPEMLETVLDAVPAMVTWYGPDGEFRKVNTAFQDTIGWSSAEVQAIDLMAECYPDPRLRAEVARFMGLCDGTWRDIPIRTRDGGTLPTRWTNVRLSDGSRIGIGVDISELRERDREIGRVYAWLHGIIEGSEDFVAAVDVECRLILFNQAWARECQRLYGGLVRVGDHASDLLSANPVDRDQAKELWSRALGGESFRVEVPFGDPDGIGGVYDLSFAPLRDENGTIVGAAHIARDVTDKRRAAQELERRVAERTSALAASERRYRTVGEAIPYGVWITDRVGMLEYVSQSFLDLVGARGMEEAAGLGWLKWLRQDDIPATREAWERCVAETGTWEWEHAVTAADGSERTVLAVGRAVRDDTGAVQSWVGLNLDITERKRDEEQLRLLVGELDHRVKNALAVVQSLAMQTVEGKQTIDEYVPAFLGRLQAMANAHGLLSRSRWKGASLRALVRGELAPFASSWVQMDGPDLRVDARAALTLASVVHELTTNAVKYGALGGPEGRLQVSWGIDGDSLALAWQESGLEGIKAPQRFGFGLDAIDSGLSYNLAGSARLDFRSDGLRCVLRLPRQHVHG